MGKLNEVLEMVTRRQGDRLSGTRLVRDARATSFLTRNVPFMRWLGGAAGKTGMTGCITAARNSGRDAIAIGKQHDRLEDKRGRAD